MGVGLLRVLLALAVVMVHAGTFYGYQIANGVVSVRAFFIISGFYMALILKDKYTNYWKFLKSRFLRIFPIYWVTLVLVIAVGLLAHQVSGTWGELQGFADYGQPLSGLSWLSVIIVNLTIIGRGLVSSLGIDPQTGWFTILPSLDGYTLSARPFLLIPQAWTIVLELSFYLVAPFIVNRKNWLLMVLLIASISLRIVLQRFGLFSFSWRYGFFPTELALFLLGIFAYRLYSVIKSYTWKYTRYMAGIGTALLIGVVLSYTYWPLTEMYRELLLYLIFTLLLPFAFLFSKQSKWDRAIGDLSYPIYIGHLLVMSLVYPTLFNRFIGNIQWLSVIVFLACIPFSILMIKYVQNPIDQLRARYRNKV